MKFLAGNQIIGTAAEKSTLSLIPDDSIFWETDTGLGSIHNGTTWEGFQYLTLTGGTLSGDLTVGGGVTANTFISSAINSNVGRNNTATGAGSSAFGDGNNASNDDASAFGHFNTASGYYSSAFGANNTASGSHSHAFGKGVNNAEADSLAIGFNSKHIVLKAGTINLNEDTTVDGDITAEVFTSTTGNVSIGSGNISTGSGYIASESIAVGVNNSATGPQSNALGCDNTASGYYSSSIGYTNSASGDFSAAIGSRNTVVGNDCSAVGAGNTASVGQSSAFGHKVNVGTGYVQEFGYWSGATTRNGAIRIHTTGMIASTIQDRSTAYTASVATVGAEADNSLASNMFAIRRNGAELLIDLNDAGTIKTLNLGTAT